MLEIDWTAVAFATFVGGAYGETKKGLLLFDINIFAFATNRSLLSRYRRESIARSASFSVVIRDIRSRQLSLLYRCFFIWGLCGGHKEKTLHS